MEGSCGGRAAGGGWLGVGTSGCGCGGSCGWLVAAIGSGELWDLYKKRWPPACGMLLGFSGPDEMSGLGGAGSVYGLSRWLAW